MKYPPQQTNLHTHTERCKHASGNVADYVTAAARQGCRLLGMTDHCPFPDDRWLFVRMESRELEPYLDEIDAARKLVPEVELLGGLECEYIPDRHSYYEDVFLANERIQFLVGGVHWVCHEGEWIGLGELSTPAHLASHARNLIETMESGLFSYLAHPDNFGIYYRDWDANCESCARDVLSAAASLQVPLEINGYGMRKPRVDTAQGSRWMYPLLPFWELAAEYDIQVVCNSDAHRPMDVMANIPEGILIASTCGLTLADPVQMIPSLDS
ncbi:MAG: histidinol-phosphatase [Verrucomicrobia bacterium]|jgi:histidinol-phosphatase (PHP family)|nr:histidinol-phosphatase [Verrucomicrobiota bacterium]MBT7066488.1 histidinol-phosphatase [Verrucomicrobiota bacterium]MBT7698964.1 histidinol-phosphatase [Verrucomicrobiota bacterium]